MLQGTVSVSPTNGAGERLPGASLKLTPASAGQPSRSIVTNEQGEHKFTDLAAGIYTVQIDLPGFKQQTKTVTLQKDTTAWITLILSSRGLQQMSQQWQQIATA
jgi:PEGA domain.